MTDTAPQAMGSGDTAPQAVGVGDTVPQAVGDGGDAHVSDNDTEPEPEPEPPPAVAAAAAAAAAAETAAAAVEASAAAAAAATRQAAAAAAARVAAAAVAAAKPSAAAKRVRWFTSPWPFLRHGLRDFKTNIKRTWPIILFFIGYLFASAWVLYRFLKVSAQIPSWRQALYSTWISMSTAGELTTRSSKWVWALSAANSLVGLLFFGFIVWLVTTSLYQPPDS